MKIKEARDELAKYTGKLSDIVRQLGLAGLALIWVLRVQSPNGNSIPKLLIPAGLMILLGLAIDLLHYAAGSLWWSDFNKRKHREHRELEQTHKAQGESFDPDQQDFHPPAERDKWTSRFFWSKCIAMLLAYVFLIFYLLTLFSS